jgi:hypothetical protein
MHLRSTCLTLISLMALSAPTLTATEPRPDQDGRAVVLSRAGSGRASAYPPTNKVVTLGNRTHVTWLDSEAEGFRVRIRTLDRETGVWSPAYTIGDAQDNHGGAAITADAEGYLHALYYPHHEAMRYRRSVRPNDAAEWSEEETFGEALTYPVVMAGKDGSLLTTARRSFDSWEGFTPPQGSRPWETEIWRREPGGRWERAGSLLKSRFPGYAQFAEALWWGEDGKTLHLACRIYETDYHQTKKLYNTVGYLVSRDGGRTWQRRDGTRVALPATADDLDVIVRGGAESNDVLTAGGVITDARGQPQVLYSIFGAEGARTFLASPGEGDTWRHRDLSRELPKELAGWEMIIPGAITRTDTGRWVIAATLQRVPAGEAWWGHRSGEVAQLWSDDDGATFKFEAFRPFDPRVPRWLPNLERATGHHRVPHRPGIVFTDGEAGAGNDVILNNRVIWIEAGDGNEQPRRTRTKH